MKTNPVINTPMSIGPTNSQPANVSPLSSERTFFGLAKLWFAAARVVVSITSTSNS
ncbi:hypothetical protein [Candidatus Pristimantibacillus sp. PTI5]|uniref:hypothetical protein n=1 Tax=Candidatus Pristimantibacillus sp. PTI5 TaxID=3400422 RepID=UPI003B027B2E